MSLFTDSERRGIYFYVGKTSDAERYVKAPVDMIRYSGEWYLEAASFGGDANAHTAATLDAGEEKYLMSREEGYHSLNNIVIAPHEFGDLKDNVFGIHRFGFI